MTFKLSKSSENRYCGRIVDDSNDSNKTDKTEIAVDRCPTPIIWRINSYPGFSSSDWQYLRTSIDANRTF